MAAGAIDWETVYREHQPDLRRLVARLVPAPVVDDIVQETFAGAYRSRGRVDSSRPLWPWLATIAYRAAAQWWRSRRPGDELLRDEPRDGPSSAAFPGSDSHLAHLERTGAIADALAALNPRHRRVLYLHAVHGLPFDHLARVERVSPKAARSVLERAKARFRGEYHGPAAGVGFALGGCRGWAYRARHRVECLWGIEGCLAVLAAASVTVGAVGILAEASRSPEADAAQLASSSTPVGIAMPTPERLPAGNHGEAPLYDEPSAPVPVGPGSPSEARRVAVAVHAGGGISHSPERTRGAYYVTVEDPLRRSVVTIGTEAYCDSGHLMWAECTVLRALPAAPG